MTHNKFHSLMLRYFAEQFRINKQSPLYFVVKSKDKIHVCTKQFENETTKREVLDIYAVILKAEQAEMYTLVSEVWFYKEKNGPDIKDIKVPPSEHPEKRQGFLCMTTNKEGNTLFDMMEIISNKGDLYLRFDDTCSKTERTEGSFGSLFNRISLNEKKLKALIMVWSSTDKEGWYFELDEQRLMSELEGSLI